MRFEPVSSPSLQHGSKSRQNLETTRRWFALQTHEGLSKPVTSSIKKERILFKMLKRRRAKRLPAIIEEHQSCCENLSKVENNE